VPMDLLFRRPPPLLLQTQPAHDFNHRRHNSISTYCSSSSATSSSNSSEGSLPLEPQSSSPIKFRVPSSFSRARSSNGYDADDDADSFQTLYEAPQKSVPVPPSSAPLRKPQRSILPGPRQPSSAGGTTGSRTHALCKSHSTQTVASSRAPGAARTDPARSTTLDVASLVTRPRYQPPPTPPSTAPPLSDRSCRLHMRRKIQSASRRLRTNALTTPTSRSAQTAPLSYPPTPPYSQSSFSASLSALSNSGTSGTEDTLRGPFTPIAESPVDLSNPDGSKVNWEDPECIVKCHNDVGNKRWTEKDYLGVVDKLRTLR
jgi:hypothetical protein